jgi:hypothetical protein
MTLQRAAFGLAACLALAGAALSAEANAQAYQEGAVAGGGTLKGKLVYNGRVPTRTIVPTKDPEVCGQPREEPEIKVGPDKGVHNGMVYLEGVKQGKAWPAAAAAAKAPVLDNKKCIFEPRVQAIRAGKLSVLNSDPVLHNTHGFYGRRTAFNIALPNQGQSIDVDLARSGQVRVECDAHGWMLGWVYVLENPYYAVTGEDGAFAIGDVPPGDYTLVADHEYTGPVKVQIKVKGGETVEVPVELKKP